MKRKIFFLGGVILLLVLLLASIRYGAVGSKWQEVLQVLRTFKAEDQAQQLILTLRIPRTLGAVAVGAAFSVAGALMQGITGNPIADSGLLGVNSGAGLGLALAFALFASPSPLQAITASFIGACFAVILLYVLSKKVSFGINPIKVVLLGASLSSFFSAISQGISLFFNLNQDITFWFVGGTGNVTWTQIELAWPLVAIGLVGSFALGSQVTLLSMGDERALSLGKDPNSIRRKAMLLVLILAGTSVSLVGTISFLGLLVPHVVRYFVGHDYRLVLPASALLGSIFFLLADIGSRVIAAPLEMPVGVLVIMIGAPFLLVKVRRGTL